MGDPVFQLDIPVVLRKCTEVGHDSRRDEDVPCKNGRNQARPLSDKVIFPLILDCPTCKVWIGGPEVNGELLPASFLSAQTANDLLRPLQLLRAHVDLTLQFHFPSLCLIHCFLELGKLGLDFGQEGSTRFIMKIKVSFKLEVRTLNFKLVNEKGLTVSSPVPS